MFFRKSEVKKILFVIMINSTALTFYVKNNILMHFFVTVGMVKKSILILNHN